MASLQNSDITLNLSPTPINAVLGRQGTFSLGIGNANLAERAYNLSCEISLPNGVSYLSSSVTPNSIVTNPDNSITVTWTNIKDLSPSELNYKLDITIISDENFRGTPVVPVPFDTPISSVNVSISVDSKSSGNEAIDNSHIIKTHSSDFVPKRYSLKKSAPEKVPKGAALPSDRITTCRWPYEYTLEVVNNTREASTEVTITDTLPNGVRYLDALTITGTNIAAGLNSPNVSYTAPPSTNFTEVTWTAITLPPTSFNIIKFKAAIYNNYTLDGIENSGNKIHHNTVMINNVSLNGQSGLITSTAATTAMDALINKNINPTSIDVNIQMLISLNYKINQYDDIINFKIIDVLPKGSTYDTTSTPTDVPESVVYNSSEGTTTITWSFLTAAKSTDGTIQFHASVLPKYTPTNNVIADDTLVNTSSIYGTNSSTLTDAPDDSKASAVINIPHISKEILHYYYNDGLTVKPMKVAAPGDLIEFKITYDASTLTALQHNIEIDEFPPLNMGPLSSSVSAAYTGLPSTPPPETISPNGLRWTLGDLPGNTLWTATFKVPVMNIDYVGTKNNLTMLTGRNISELSYSDRALAPVFFGKPNVTLNKTVTGPDINSIKAGETYNYTITISNRQKIDNSVVDAFQMAFTDVIPTGLSYASGSLSVTASPGLTHTAPSVAGQNISMTINFMPPDGTLTLRYSLTVDSTIGSGAVFANTATLGQPYSQYANGYKYPGDPLIASTTLRSQGAIIVSKIGAPYPAKIGDTVTYFITVTVPAGTTAYNLALTDTYPSTSQLYIGNATRNSLPITPLSPPPAGTVVFPTETTPIIATASDISIVYSFDVRIIDGLNTAPYSEDHPDIVTVNWNTTPNGSPAAPVSYTFNHKVVTPHIKAMKNQRNIFKGGPFTSATLDYQPGDEIEYKITLTNDGKAPAYNVSFIDTLDSFLSLITGSVTVSTGYYSYSASSLAWTIPYFEGFNSTATITFKVKTLTGVGAYALVSNKGTAISYNTNNNGFGETYSPISSNTVEIRSPKLTIRKESDITEGKIGDVIKYTIKVTIPEGVIGYKVSIEDLLPNDQSYMQDSATLEVRGPSGGPPVPITPDFISAAPAIRFTPPTTYDASEQFIVLILRFEATITNAIHIEPYYETQTNKATVRWAATPSSEASESETASLNINVKTPNIIVKRQQRLNSRSYTTEIIKDMMPGDTLTYKFTVQNNGTAPAYNTVVTDIISDFLNYSGNHIGPIGLSHASDADAGTFTLSNGGGGSLIWTIPVLSNGAVLELDVSLTLLPVSANNLIYNQATFVYSTNEVPKAFVSYNGSSNTLTSSSAGLILSKTVQPNVAVGDTITYTLTITIPANIYAYNLTLEDVLPSTQQYVAGSAYRNEGSGNVPITPTASGNSIIFTDPETTLLGMRTITYTFNALVLSGNKNPPYKETQTNSAIATWRLSPNGTLAPPITATASLTVLAPHIKLVKEQKKASDPDTSFTTAPLTGLSMGDEIEYRISLTNDGASQATSLIITDVISSYLTFIPDSPPNPLVSNTVPAGSPGGTITINGTSITIGVGPTISLKLKFKIIYPADFLIISNEASIIYRGRPLASPLPEVKSNKVSLDREWPKIEKTCSRASVNSGDTVTYTIKVTIPKGTTTYYIQLIDHLQSGQSYAGNYTQIPPPPGGFDPVINLGYIWFPPFGNIIAPTTDKIFTCTYDAVLTSLSTNPQEIQTNQASLYWNADDVGTPGPTQTSSSQVYVSNLTLTLENAQRNFTTELSGPPYYGTPINAHAGDYILYELKAINKNSAPLYQITVTDIIDTKLNYLGIAAGPNYGSINYSGNTLSWLISLLPPGETARAVIAVQVLPGVPLGAAISNSMTSVFAVDSATPDILYNSKPSNTILLTFEDIVMTKTGSVTTARLGETITYTITTKIPQGSALYNFKLVDTLPIGQSFISGTAQLLITPPGSPAQGVTPTVSGNILEFPEILSIDTTNAAATYTYTFQTTVKSGKAYDDYIDIQTNTAEITWKPKPSATYTVNRTSEFTVTVPMPNLILTKMQRNETLNTTFSREPLLVDIGDILHYKLIISNTGAAPAYNVTIKDTLDQYQPFNSIVYTPPAPPNNSMLYSNNLVTWTLEYVNPNESYEAVFSIREEEPAAAGDNEKNLAKAIGKTSTMPPPALPITLPTVYSNDVYHTYPVITITKNPSPLEAYIGSIIHYTINFTLAKGTFAYKLLLLDALPIEQNYVANSGIFTNPNSGSTPKEPLILNELLICIDEENFGPYNADTTFTYEFDSIVETAIFNENSNTKSQINNTTIQWKFDTQGTKPADPLDATSNAACSVNILCPLMIDLYQRNVSNNKDFTKDTIEASKGDIVEYKVVITNINNISLYNLDLYDTLSQALKYLNPTYIPPLASIHHTGGNADGTVHFLLTLLKPHDSVEFRFTTTVLGLPLKTIENYIFGTFSPSPIENHPTSYLASKTTYVKTVSPVEPTLPPKPIIVENVGKVFHYCLSKECGKPTKVEGGHSVIVDKVFSQCLSKEWFENIKVKGKGNLADVKFHNGKIIEGSITLNLVDEIRHIYNVGYLVSITYRAELIDDTTYYLEDTLPPMKIRGAMYIPHIGPNNFPIYRVDTYSKPLYINNTNNTFSVGIYCVNSILYTVDLLIPYVESIKPPYRKTFTKNKDVFKPGRP